VSLPVPPPLSEADPAAPRSASLKGLAREAVETVLLTLLVYLAVNFTTGRFRVEGNSMEPSMHSEEYVLVDKVAYRFGNPRRGDIVVFQYPRATERDFIKRIIGLPGEVVEINNGMVRVNGQPLGEPYIAAPPGYSGTWTLAPNEYFVLGDNRNSSSDSHSWGALQRQYLIGRAILIYWPPPLWGTVPHYTYAASPADPISSATPYP
jgi:signal peptidase I